MSKNFPPSPRSTVSPHTSLHHSRSTHLWSVLIESWCQRLRTRQSRISLESLTDQGKGVILKSLFPCLYDSVRPERDPLNLSMRVTPLNVWPQDRTSGLLWWQREIQRSSTERRSSKGSDEDVLGPTSESFGSTRSPGHWSWYRSLWNNRYLKTRSHFRGYP